MAGSHTEQFARALQGWTFSGDNGPWELVTCGAHEAAGDLFLHVALRGESLLTLTIHVEHTETPTLAAWRIADRIVDWLAQDDGHAQGFIDAREASTSTRRRCRSEISH
jgi:hypothetical protein